MKNKVQLLMRQSANFEFAVPHHQRITHFKIVDVEYLKKRMAKEK